jgi:glycosyltransferase involved in cell wall biosynthesis
MAETNAGGRQTRLLFASYHCYFDPSSGAALSTRDLLELLAGRGWACRVFCGPQLDFEDSPPLDQLLQDQEIAFEVRQVQLGPVPVTLFHFEQGGVPVSIYHTPLARPHEAPGREEGLPFLALLGRAIEEIGPDLLLTYGGDWLARETIALAKRHGVRVVFTLRNFAYHDAELFRSVDAVHVPSRFAQAHYRRTLGLESTAIPGPWDWTRLRCPDPVGCVSPTHRPSDSFHTVALTPFRDRGPYVTFVNPQPEKGVFVFARIAVELAQRRPDIPLLVVQGRAKVDWLGRTDLDLPGLPNLFVMGHTPDPRHFYGVSRLVLMPSLWQESFGRVAAEALINGLPVLASDRGALPETLANAGFLFPVPEQYTPRTCLTPTAEEVAPWVATIVSLWDDAGFYDTARQRCLAAAEAWRPERLGACYEEFLSAVLRKENKGDASLFRRINLVQ